MSIPPAPSIQLLVATSKGKKLVLESDDEMLEFLGTHEVVDVSKPDMSPPPSCCDQG